MIKVRQWGSVLLFAALGLAFGREAQAQTYAGLNILPASCNALLADDGAPAQFTLSATGGIPPYAWSVDPADLPAWIALDPATGVLSGAAAETGVARFTVSVFDAAGAFDTQSCLLAVDPASPTVESFRHQLNVDGSTIEGAKAIAVKPDGNLVLAGYAYVGQGDNAYTVAEVDAAGTLLWSDVDTTGTDGMAVGVGTDEAGNAFALVAPSASEHLGAVFLRKYDPSGALLWASAFADAGKPQQNELLAVDRSGVSYVLRHIKQQNRLYIKTAAVDPAGQPTWTDEFTGGFTAASLRVDPAGDVYIVGTEWVTRSAWVRKLSASGSLIWEWLYAPGSGTASSVEGEDIGFDFSGGAYLYLGFDEAAGPSGALLKIDPFTGDVVWEQAGAPAASALSASAKRIAADSAGSVHVVGTVYDARDDLGMQVAVLSFDQADGRYIGRALFGEAGNAEEVVAVAADGANGLFAAGSAMNAAGGSQVLLARYATPTLTDAPQISPPGGTFGAEQWVVLDCPAAGAVIAYTLDGSEPSLEIGPLVDPGTSILVDRAATLRAVAGVPGSVERLPSAEAAADFTFAATPPSVSPSGGIFTSPQVVTIASLSLGVGIRYTTDGTAPSPETGTLLQNGGTVTVDRSLTLCAAAFRDGWAASEAACSQYQMETLPPAFTPGEGAYRSGQTVRITSPTPGAMIAYTTDGSAPSPTNGAQVASGASVTLAGTLTLKAMAYRDGWADSPAASATYTFTTVVTATPTLAPLGTTYYAPQAVTISSATAGATIRYTTDGTTPTRTNGTELANNGTATVDRSMSLKAIAFSPVTLDSTAVSGTYTLKVSTLAFAPPAGTYTAAQSVTITTPTEGATIRYTTDGTTPSATVGTVLANGGSVVVDRTMSLKAVAYKTGWTTTTALTASYTLKPEPVTLTPGVTTSFEPVSVTVATPTADALIRYTTDGTTPTAIWGTELANGGTVTADRTMTVKAVAYKTGWTATTAASATYTLKVSPLTFTPPAGTYAAAQTVTIATPTEGATIRYTTNGTTPTAAIGTVLPNGGTVVVDRTMSLKAVAYKTGWTTTTAATASYTLKPEPVTLTPGATTSFEPVQVTIATPTEGATIRYTTNGTTPTATAGTVLANGGTVTANQTMTIKAVAYKTGWTATTAASALYTLKVAPLTFTPPAGTYAATQTVTIATPTAGATIRYTTDGTVPSATVGTVLANGGTVTVDRTMSLKAVAYKTGWTTTTAVTTSYTLKPEPVTLTPGVTTSFEPVPVTIATPTADALIRYTTDGLTPTPTFGTVLANGGTVTADRTMTIKAVAYKTGWTATSVASAAYTLKVDALTFTAPPGTYSSNQIVTVATPTAGALIRYTTDGTTPTASTGAPLANGGTISVDQTTSIKAIAYKTGWTATTAVTALYTLKPEPVTLTPGTTSSFEPMQVTIATPTAGATIRYTTDATTPTATVGTVLANGGTITVDKTTTVKAVAYKTGWTATAAASASYTLKVDALTFTPVAGTYSAPQTVTVATPTVGATIRYTTDGTTPTATSGTLLANGGTIAVDGTSSIRAVAFKTGWTTTTSATASYTLKPEPVTLTPGTTSSETPVQVTIASPTEGALIRYTIDGTMPTATAGTALANGGAITVDRTTTVKAVAYQTGWTTTSAATATYTLKVAPLTFTPAPGTYSETQTVTIATPTVGATIRYTTDGTTPTATVGTELANGGTVTVDRTLSIRAVAYKTGWTTTTLATAAYTLKPAPVTLTPGTTTATEPFQVTIATPTTGSQIRYTTDGTTPTATIGTELANGGTITVDRTMTVKAVAYQTGWTATSAASVTYTLKVAPLTFTPPAGTYSATQSVTIATPTEDALIRYTTDGTTPTTTVGTELANGGTVTVDQTMSIRAIAYKPGWTAATVVSATYSMKVAPVSFTPAPGTYETAQAVAVGSATEGAFIRYTTDGTLPSATVGTELANGGTIIVDQSMTIKAIAYQTGWTSSSVLSGSYVYDPPLTGTTAGLGSGSY